METQQTDVGLEKVTPAVFNQALKDGKAGFAIMDGTGDTKYIWDPTNADEVEAAERMFNDLVKDKKYAAFHVDDDGNKTERMRTFDSKAGKIILTRPPVGG